MRCPPGGAPSCRGTRREQHGSDPARGPGAPGRGGRDAGAPGGRGGAAAVVCATPVVVGRQGRARGCGRVVRQGARPGPVLRVPYYAPLGAVVATTSTLARSVRESAQAILAILVGAAIARGVDLVLAPSALSVALVVGLALLCAGWRRFGEMGVGGHVRPVRAHHRQRREGRVRRRVRRSRRRGRGHRCRHQPARATAAPHPDRGGPRRAARHARRPGRGARRRPRGRAPPSAEEWEERRREVEPTLTRARDAVVRTREAARATSGCAGTATGPRRRCGARRSSRVGRRHRVARAPARRVGARGPRRPRARRPPAAARGAPWTPTPVRCGPSARSPPPEALRELTERTQELHEGAGGAPRGRPGLLRRGRGRARAAARRGGARGRLTTGARNRPGPAGWSDAVVRGRGGSGGRGRRQPQVCAACSTTSSLDTSSPSTVAVAATVTEPASSTVARAANDW